MFVASSLEFLGSDAELLLLASVGLDRPDLRVKMIGGAVESRLTPLGPDLLLTTCFGSTVRPVLCDRGATLLLGVGKDVGPLGAVASKLKNNHYNRYICYSV